MWLLFSRLEDTASKEDVNRVVVMYLLLCSQTADHARCKLFIDQVACKLHVGALHDLIEFILIHHCLFRIRAVLLSLLWMSLLAVISLANTTVHTSLSQLISKHSKSEHTSIELYVLDGLYLLEIVIHQVVVRS